VEPAAELTREELERYSRHLTLTQFGPVGQRRLKNARVLVVGAGGLGAPALQYLAAAGVGTLGVVDDDAVSVSNLQRQVIHTVADVGRPKVDSAADALARLNPLVTVRTHDTRLSTDNALEILGQYDLAPGGTPQLLLVAPNVVEVERELDLDPADFRQWVCLHEETHRVQFTAVPWLREHMLERTRALSVDLVPDPDQLASRLSMVVRNLPDAVREGGNGLSDLVTTPQQREEIARLTAIMSLLEGHADVIMDDVGPAVIPTVDVIRARFDERRGGRSSLDRIIRRLLGLEAKMRQYSDGAVFVHGVVDEVGMDGFNAVWESPETLPSPAEIGDHRLWLARVHG